MIRQGEPERAAAYIQMPATNVHLLAEILGPVRSEHGLTITPDGTWASRPPLDVVFVPDGVEVNAMMEHASLLGFLQAQSTSAAYLTAVCTGTLVLGAASLLHGYRDATRWLSIDLLPLFAAQPVDERVVVDRNRITGGGITAGIDFGLHLAAAVRDEQTAQEIRLMMEYHPQPPFIAGHRIQLIPRLCSMYVRHISICKRTVARLSSGFSSPWTRSKGTAA